MAGKKHRSRGGNITIRGNGKATNVATTAAGDIHQSSGSETASVPLSDHEIRKNAAKNAAIFISHVHEQADLAVAFKAGIETAFGGQCGVFVAGEPDAISPGKLWLEEIRLAIRSCQVMILLLSRESQSRPWIQFEAGGAWACDKRMIGICHGGLAQRDLAAPFSHLEVVNAGDARMLNRLFGVLQDEMERTLNQPTSLLDMQRDLQEFV